MQFFEGKGYSDEFVCGMAKIVSVLENNNANLTLTGGVTKFVHRVRTVTTAAAMLRARHRAMTKDVLIYSE